MHDSNESHSCQLPSAQTPRKTVLQVEDSPANALLVELLLARREDLILLTATGGYQGIEMASSHQPDVILMDINMPELDGLAAMKILHNNPATSHIPVIALSSNAYPSQVKQGLDAGFFRYLTKPYKLNEFLATIDLALASSAHPVSSGELPG